MKLHIITVGEPKLEYAKAGWSEYYARLSRLHTVRTTRIPDKYAYDPKKILEASEGSCRVVLEISGKQLSSEVLARFLAKRSQEGREVSFIIGGPEGLPEEVINTADHKLSLSELTFPHDLAMVVLLEALYRASTINSNHPYHK